MIQIIHLQAKHVEHAIEVFSAAFYGDPLMKFFFGSEYTHSAKYFWQYVCDIKEILDGLLLGAFIEGELLGVAFVTPPEQSKKDISSAIIELKEQLKKQVGKEAVTRIDAYINLGDANKPTEPHFYLNTLAVHPKSQGKGIGRALLEKLQKMSAEHLSSCGVALDTEKKKNVVYYERFGYRVSSVAELDSVKIWFMFQLQSHDLSN